MLYPDFNELLALKSKAARLSLASSRVVTITTAGQHHSPFRGQGLEFEEVREYAPGDDIRRIDWRVTARSGIPHTKVFKEERERSVLVCIDANSTMRFGTQNTFKSIQAARAAALISWQANSQHNRLGGCVYGDVQDGMQFFSPTRSRKSLWAMLKLLSDSQIVEQMQLVPLEETLQHVNKAAPTGALIYVISDFSNFSDALEKQLGNLQRHCQVVLITIDDSFDYSIPAIGTLLCVQNDQTNLYVDTNSPTGREQYAALWQQNRTRLQNIAGKLGIGMIELTTQEDVYQALALGLKRIGRKRVR